MSIGVPIYEGEEHLEETLRSIQSQTYGGFEVIMSVDGPDPVCEAIARRFTADSRFRLVVQPERLGWVEQINWLQGEATGDFWYYHQQDDLTAPTYIEALVTHAREHPDAALVWSDLVPFGRIEGEFAQPPPVLGSSAFLRLMAFLHEQLPAFGFRGLTRIEAVRDAAGVPTNDVADYGVDTVWLASVALSGELHHVPQPLYRKRYHGGNTESSWWAWGREERLTAWAAHCAQMLGPAMRAGANVPERRSLFLASAARLTARASEYFVPTGDLTPDDRGGLLDAFLARARLVPGADLPALLESDWPVIEQWCRGWFWTGAPGATTDRDPIADQNPAVRDARSGFGGALRAGLGRLRRGL